MLKKNNFDSNRTYIVKILLSVFFIVMVLCPLVKLLTYLFQADVGKIVQSKQFVLALKNSLFSTLISTIISVVLAYMLALCVYRTQIKHKTINDTISFLFIDMSSLSNSSLSVCYCFFFKCRLYTIIPSMLRRPVMP